jgi:protein TonB
MTQLQYNARAYRPTQSGSQRLAGLTFIAVVHFAIIYALLAGLRIAPVPRVPEPFHWRVIPDNTIPPPPPPPAEPTFPPPRVAQTIVPPIEIVIETPGPGASTVAPSSLPPSRDVATREPPPPVTLTITPARAIAATHTIPDYPPVSRRLGEQGTLRLRVSITADGAVSDARGETSSGHARLDEAAVQWVKAHWRYEPAREGSKAVPSTLLAVVTFKLQ